METGGESTKVLQAASRDIARWRGSRPKLERMPEGLWEEATRAARGLGVFRVARALGLNYSALQRRMALEDVGDVKRAERKRRRPQREAKPEFIEVRAAELNGQPGEGMVVEVAGVDGARLTIQVKGAAAGDVVRLVEAFRGRLA